MQQLWHNDGSFAPLLHCRLQIAEVGNVSCHKITVTLHNQPPLTDHPSDNKFLLYIHQCDSPCMAVVTWIIIPFPAIRLPCLGRLVVTVQYNMMQWNGCWPYGNWNNCFVLWCKILSGVGGAGQAHTCVMGTHYLRCIGLHFHLYN